jgi:hypothetical protein
MMMMMMTNEIFVLVCIRHHVEKKGRSQTRKIKNESKEGDTQCPQEMYVYTGATPVVVQIPQISLFVLLYMFVVPVTFICTSCYTNESISIQNDVVSGNHVDESTH